MSLAKKASVCPLTFWWVSTTWVISFFFLSFYYDLGDVAEWRDVGRNDLSWSEIYSKTAAQKYLLIKIHQSEFTKEMVCFDLASLFNGISTFFNAKVTL